MSIQQKLEERMAKAMGDMVAAQAQAEELRRQQREEQQKAEVSANETKKFLDKAVELALLNGSFSNVHTQRAFEHYWAFKDDGADKTNEYIQMLAKVLKDPVYGLKQTSGGYAWNGVTYESLSSLQNDLTPSLGYQPYQGQAWFQYFFRAFLAGENFDDLMTVGSIRLKLTDLQQESLLEFVDEEKLTPEDYGIVSAVAAPLARSMYQLGE